MFVYYLDQCHASRDEDGCIIDGRFLEVHISCSYIFVVVIRAM